MAIAHNSIPRCVVCEGEKINGKCLCNILCPKHDTGAGPCYCGKQKDFPLTSDPAPNPYTLYSHGHSTFHVKWKGEYIGTIQAHENWWLASYKARWGGVEISYNKPCFDTQEEAIDYLRNTWVDLAKIFRREIDA